MGQFKYKKIMKSKKIILTKMKKLRFQVVKREKNMKSKEKNSMNQPK